MTANFGNKNRLLLFLVAVNLFLTAWVFLRSMPIDSQPAVDNNPAPHSSLNDSLAEDLSSIANQIGKLTQAAESNVIEVTRLLQKTTLAIETAKGQSFAKPDSLDVTLLHQANLVSNQISGLGTVNELNVVQAAQLWREAQLTLEAAVMSLDSPEFTKLRTATTELQQSLVKAIPDLLQAAYTNARQKTSLRDGLTQWAGAGAYLALYPNDGTPSAAETAQAMGYDHERVRQELMQKAQTKYNLWACEQIKKAWVDIQDVNSPVSRSDNTKFFHSCVHFLSPIDSSLLDMSTGELYREVLQFVRERMPMETFQDLIKELENGKKRSLDETK